MTFNCWFTQLYSRYSKYVYIYTHTHTHTHTRIADCVKNTWRFLKFENQRPSDAPFSYRQSSCTVMFGVQLRWSAGQCNNELRQWNCLSKQIRLQPHSVVSDRIFKDVILLAAILCCCGYRNDVKKDQWRTVKHRNVHFRHLHLTVWSEKETPRCEIRPDQLDGKFSHFV